MKKLFWNKTPVIILTAFFCCFLWGSAFPCIKTGYRLFSIRPSDTASQLLFAGIRFMLAGFFVILFISLRDRRIRLPHKKTAGSLLLLSFLQTSGQYFFFYIGLAHTTGVKSSIIEGSGTFFALLAASLLFHYEKLTPRKILGCLVGFSGILLIELPGGGMDFRISFLGEGFVMISALLSAISASYIKRVAQWEDPGVLSGWQFLTGGGILCLCGVSAGGTLSFTASAGIFLLLYMAFISAAAYTFWSILLKYNPVSRVAIFGFMNPVIGVLLSSLILGESAQAFSLYGLGALILVVLGILIIYSVPAVNPARTPEE